MKTTKPSVLMCPPDFFEVTYEINPWMKDTHVNKGLAMKQWRHLHDRLSERAHVQVMQGQPGLPDMVFTANAGAVSPNCVVPSHFMPHERRPEEAHFKSWFRDAGFKVHELADNIGFEGAGDCLADTRGAWYWTGYGFRTEIESHAKLQEWFDAEIVSLKLVDPRFYHVDTCLTPLRGGYLMYYPGAFDSESLNKIHARVPESFRIEVEEHDACTFACNAVNIDERIYVNAVSPELQARLEARGFVIETIDVSEFIKAGGSTKCLVLQLSH